MSEPKTENPMHKLLGFAITLAIIWFFLGDTIKNRFLPMGAPAFTIDVHELRRDLSRNPAAVMERAKGRPVAVTGPVHRIQMVGNTTVVSIGVLFSNMECHVPKSKSGRVAAIKTGDPVKVKGRLNASGIYMTLKPCELI